MERSFLKECVIDWRSVTLFLLTLCIVALCGFMIRPFLPAMTGAIVLAIVTRSPHRWIESKLKHPSVAAAASVILVTLSIIGPAFLLAWNIALQMLGIGRMVQSGTIESGIEGVIRHSPPRLSAAIQAFIASLDFNQALQKSAGFLVSRLTGVLNSSVSALIQIVVMLFILFFLYRDSGFALSSLRSLLPMNATETDMLLSRIKDTIRATVLGRGVVAALQGLVAGITFAGVGVQGASLLGIVTALCAIIPSVGAFVVWVPVALYLAAVHRWIAASILTAIGVIVISSMDNFLYPILVGTRLKMHPVLIFLSIVGGIWLTGISGLVVGPVAFAVAESLLLVWRRRTVGEKTPEAAECSQG